MENQIKEAIDKMIRLNQKELCEELIRREGIKSAEIAKAALESGIFYPSILYVGACIETRDRIIAMLEQEDAENANGYLNALAIIGDDTVIEYFEKWEKHPKMWRKKLFVGPYIYAMEAGWYIENGKRKKLFFEKCYALEKVEKCLPGENIFGKTGLGRCPNCGSAYVNNLIVDGRDERLNFLGIKGRIKILYCVSCVYEFDFQYCRYEVDGESTFIRRELHKGELWEYHGEPDETLTVEDEDLNEYKSFVLSPKPVSQNYCDEFERSAIGGRPAFVNDADYADCPECGNRMMHLAQLGENYTGGGTHYIQICKECKIAAVTYQQT